MKDNILGKGAFGVVVLGSLNGRAVAYKKNIKFGVNDLLRNEREVNFLKKLNSSRYTVDFINLMDLPIIFMELMAGSVRHLLDKNPNLSWKTKLLIAIQMFEAIDYLHHFSLNSGYFSLFFQQPIVHQDIKSDNLLVNTLEDDPNIMVKLCDFGNARQMDQISIPMIGTFCLRWHHGTFGGSRYHAAPEIVRAMLDKTDCCELGSDVFSAGVTLWEIATGERPSRTLHPRAGFFSPVIEKCTKSNVKDRISARQALKNLRGIQIGPS